MAGRYIGNTKTDVESFMTRQNFLMWAEEIKKDKSLDYIEGFDAGALWLRNFIVRLAGGSDEEGT